MVDPIGTSLGAVSLCIQIVDGIAKGYRFYLNAVGMPARCVKLRTRLGMEYQRLLSWTDAAGLLDYESDQDLPELLLTNRLVLVDVLCQIRGLIDEFAELNGRYKELNEIPGDEVTEAKRQIDIVGAFATVFEREVKVEMQRKHLRGTNHILRMVKDTHDVVKNPRRLRWLAFDDSAFSELLANLSICNNYLEELLRGRQARTLVENSRTTLLEIVAIRSSVEQLKVLIAAASLGQGTDQQVRDKRLLNGDHDMLQSLAGFKAASLANSSASDNEDGLPAYQQALEQPELVAGQVSFLGDPEDILDGPFASRVPGLLEQPGVGAAQRRIWVEWKPYAIEVTDNDEDFNPRADSVRRTRELVALLRLHKPAEFCVPSCLGYFQDTHKDSSGNRMERFGLVFDRPAWSGADDSPRSLFELMTFSSEPKFVEPALEHRIALARKLAVCLLYLHAVQWLHKAIRSDGILVFPRQHLLDLENCTLSGFEYARPDREGATYTGDADSKELVAWDLYRHPEYQGVLALGNFRKTFDIYSMGLVLLELALWQPIHKIMGFQDVSELTPRDRKDIRARLLASENDLFHRVQARMGEKYARAVQTCITGCEALDVGDEENEMDAEVGVRLQRAYVRLVTDPLCDILR